MPLLLVSFQEAAPKRVSYRSEIAPILRERCVTCHGPKSPSEGLDLSSLAGVRRGSAGGPVVTPGAPERSLLFASIVPHNGKAVMPPGRALSGEQVETLRRWILEGAQDDDEAASWFESAPGRPAIPTVKRAEWVRNPIDAFVLARLERERVSPAAEADRKALHRRVTLALTGKPPTAPQLLRFVSDRRPDAYERFVDELLAQSRLEPSVLDAWKAARGDLLKERIEVNRRWTWLLGRGIVEPSWDAPSRKASHPELLDWLTLEASRQGWDLKRLTRLIVTSATFRQSAEAPKSFLVRDPQNELLARGPGY